MFREGQGAMARKEYPFACAKFAASLQLEPGIGTRLWLADCYEKQGLLASAWRVFREAAAAAAEAKDTRAQVASSRAAQLEPKLARIVLRVPSPAPKDLEIRIDGVKIASAQWSVPQFVDRGRHEIRASGGFERVLDVTEDGRAYEIVVGEPPPAATPSTEAKPSPAWSIAGWSLVAGGAVGIGLGSYFGLHAKSRYDEAAPHCPSTCDSVGYETRNEAFRWAAGSTVAFVAGGAFAVAGVTLLVLSPSSPKKTGSYSLQFAGSTVLFQGVFQ